MSTIKKPFNNKTTRAQIIREIYNYAEQEEAGQTYASSVIDAGDSNDQLTGHAVEKLLNEHGQSYEDDNGNINPELIDFINDHGGDTRDTLTLVNFLGY